MKRLSQFIREKDDEDDCKCSKGMSVLAVLDNYCICISDEPEGLDDEEDDEDEINEGFVPAGKPGKSVEFPLIQYDETVRVKITPDGMFIKVGDSQFFQVPDEEQRAIWRVIEDRLHS